MEEVIIDEKQEQATKKWKFRKLKAPDLFVMLPILKKIGISNFRRCFSGDIIKGLLGENAGKSRAEKIDIATFGAALEFGQVLIEGLDTCENEIYNLLEQTSNLSRSEIKDLDLMELPEMIIDFVSKEEFAGFLKVAERYIK